MKQWSLTLDGASGILSAFESGEAQFTLGSEEAADVLRVQGEGVAARHAMMWIVGDRLQVEDLAGGTLVNGEAIEGRVEVAYPASVQVGEVTLWVEVKAVASASSLEVTIPQRGARQSTASLAVTIPQRVPTNRGSSADVTMPQRPRHEAEVRQAGNAAEAAAQNKAPLSGEYTLVREIARGGMGQIYFSEDPQLERQVAVKVSRVGQAGEDPRFSKEAKVLAHLAHPNIVPIYNIGVDGQNRPFYSMKLVKGRTLQAVLHALREGDAAVLKEYTRAALLTVFCKVCDAMAFAHSKGVLHRDLKPDNIMVGEYGEVLVMDWGLAKVLGGREEVTTGESPVKDTGDYGMTLEGEVMGTPQYMSPEQAEGMVGDLDARSDIYSLGGILYAILTQRPPIDGKTLNEVLTKVRKGEISSMVTKRAHKSAGGVASEASPAAMGEAVPEALRSVTLKAMATNRNERYESVALLVADIEAYQHGFATSAEHAGLGRQLLLLIKRNKAVAGMCALLAVAAVVFSVRLLASERAARESATVARANEQKAVEERRAAQTSSAKAQIALAQSEHQAQKPQEMRRVLDEVPREFRDQHWSYLDAKLAPPAISFEIPEAPVEAAFPTNKAPGCFLTIQRNGNVRYLDPVAGFGSPLFRLDGATKEMAFAFYEEEGRLQLAVATNRSTRVGEKTYPASFELREVPSGKLVYKVGMDLPCATVDFSPQGNLVCLGRRPPVSATLQMRNAYSGDIVWEGGPKEAVSSKFSADEKRLVCVLESKGFEDLDPWTGASLGLLKNGQARPGAWSPNAERVYAMWRYADKHFLRCFYTKDGTTQWEYPYARGGVGSISCGGSGRWLFFTKSRSSEGRVVELLDRNNGIVVHNAYIIGDYDKYLTHTDENHFLCLGNKKAAFLRWNLPESLVPDLPRFDGPFFFLDGDSRVAACTSKDYKDTFKIYDLKKPKGEAGPAFSVPVRGRISSNKARDLFSYKEDSATSEAVIARVDAQGIRKVSRWKSPSLPQLSPSGDRAWTREGLYETVTGRLLQKYDRKDLGWTHTTRWLDEEHVLEIAWAKRKDENDSGEFSETVYILWEVDTGEIVLKVSEARARTFGVSPDGLWIAEGGEDGRLRIRSAKTLEIQKDYKVHDAGVSRAEWHPTKPVIVTCSEDYWVKAWDARDGTMVQGFRCAYIPGNIVFNDRGDLLGVANYSASQILPLDLSHVRD